MAVRVILPPIEPPHWLILTAIHAEADAVRRALVASGVLAADGCEIRVIGVRATRLADLPREGVRGVILAGFAGALDPSLRIGDIVVDGHSPALPGARSGTIHTASAIVATPADKASLFAATGALAVDMEAAEVRPVVAQMAVPFLHVRAISDTAAEALDPAVLGFVDDVGRVRPMKLAMRLIRNPSLIPTLTRLGKNARLAGRKLGEAIVQMVLDENRSADEKKIAKPLS